MAAYRDVTRLEAFSDGVFAIAITLLVLDLKVPRDLPAETSLASALMRQWPAYLAFLCSFVTIGVMWINHHRMFTHNHSANGPSVAAGELALPYLACFGVAFFSVTASVAANILLAGFFALPPHVAARSLPKG
jgi:uncharacterized membrane protein